MKFPHTATYWVADGQDGFKSTYSAPIQIKVRWETKSILFTNSEGQEMVSRAVVYYNNDIINNAYLYLGETNSDNPIMSGSYRVRNVNKSYNIDGTKFITKVIL